jgi:hypothetical protein
MQHVVTRWQAFLSGGRGPFTTSCGIGNWRGAGEHDPLCPKCAAKHGLPPGGDGNGRR